MSYSLRTLLLAVAAIAALIAYEMNWIRQRQAFLAQHPVDDMAYEASDGSGGIVRQRAPSGLWLFGERGVLDIEIRLSESEVHVDVDGQRAAHPRHPAIAKAMRLFPEANISAWTMDFGENLWICERVMQVYPHDPTERWLTSRLLWVFVLAIAATAGWHLKKVFNRCGTALPVVDRRNT